jgi:deazaflavin-dependent oxidoreductase (nitroreductase family)
VSETPREREEEPAVAFGQEQYLYLTTHGRKSGKLREIEIWFTHQSGRFYLIAEYATSQWLQNLRANAQVEVRVGSHHFSCHARILSEQEDADLVRSIQDLSRSKYGWGDGVVVELSPRL